MSKVFSNSVEIQVYEKITKVRSPIESLSLKLIIQAVLNHTEFIKNKALIASTAEQRHNAHIMLGRCSSDLMFLR